MSLELRKRPKGSALVRSMARCTHGNGRNSHIFKNGDHIACVVTNHSDVAVWPYVLEFAEDGSVDQRYPYSGGEELLASGRSTKEVAQMALRVSSENAFQLAEDNLINMQDDGGAENDGSLSGSALLRC
jgi:hypothetical protein